MLDRTKWPGCGYCSIDSDIRKVIGYDNDRNAIVIISGNGLSAIDGGKWGFLVDYCPKCGQPLTEKAWAELEKRLEELGWKG